MSIGKALEAKGEIGSPLIGGSFELIDTEGKTFSDKDLIGKFYLLYFGFTHCPDICPEELSKISEVVELVKKSLPDAPLVPVFITCDPERDSSSIIKSYLQGTQGIESYLILKLYTNLDFGNDFIGLTGPPEVVKEVAKKFRVYYRPTQTSDNGDYLVDHSIFYYLMGPDGKFLANFGRNITANECANSVLNVISPKRN